VCRVVVCDDQHSFREVVALVLGLESGLEVVGQAADGAEAIRVVERLRPDVLLLDIAMPVMDGLEALPHIRAAAPDTRVVMMSGLSSDGIRQRALDAGAELFIEKGADVEQVAATIAGLCRDGGDA
jgi:DNA-binding NarL/FixJ family response regulator